jgi:hypothetical protein
LQSYFLREVDLGLYNRLYYDPINANLALASSHRLTLIRMSLDQSLIGKSRVLWERVLVLIYYLEFGKDLSSDARGSRKGRFFKDIGEDDLRWGWMSVYQPVIARYDDLFRTPEFHSGSRLRKELEGAPPPDANGLLEPLNASMNVVWKNLLVVVAGGSQFSFDLMHMRQGAKHGLDPKWQAWAERAQNPSAQKHGEEGPPTVVRR